MTTAPPATTTTTLPGSDPPARTFAISPASGLRNSPITASGTACIGEAAGVSIETVDPTGTPIAGDGGSARPDGTWSTPISINGTPGVYTLRAKCRTGALVLFE